MLHKHLSHEIIGLSMKVQNWYGSHHNERIYQKALEEEFDLKSFGYVSQPRLPVISIQTGKTLGWYQPDFLVDDVIILEIKAAQFPTQKFEDQLNEYLRCSEYQVGYLINFCISPLFFKRFFNTLSPIKQKND